MLNIISVGTGIVIFILSLVLYSRIYLFAGTKRYSLRWLILCFLVTLFLIGYLAFEHFLITGEEMFDYKAIVSQVFLWGSVFVLFCAWIFYATVREMDASNEMLKELDRMKSNFLSNISHELHTPLASIKGFTHTILQEKKMEEKDRIEFMHIISEESERLSKLITRLLNLSRIEVGRIRIDRKIFDLSAAAREVMNSYKTSLMIKELTLESDLPQALPIYADQHYFKEALNQLLENAVQYTNKGGMIKIFIRDNADKATISVSDTGCGIPKEDLPHIFERFYKVERPAEKVGGIGMGLAVVKYIVEAHGGTISVESEAGKGTTFGFTLPKGKNERI